ARPGCRATRGRLRRLCAGTGASRCRLGRATRTGRRLTRSLARRRRTARGRRTAARRRTRGAPTARRTTRARLRPLVTRDLVLDDVLYELRDQPLEVVGGLLLLAPDVARQLRGVL